MPYLRPDGKEAGHHRVEDDGPPRTRHRGGVHQTRCLDWRRRGSDIRSHVLETVSRTSLTRPRTLVGSGCGQTRRPRSSSAGQWVTRPDGRKIIVDTYGCGPPRGAPSTARIRPRWGRSEALRDAGGAWVAKEIVAGPDEGSRFRWPTRSARPPPLASSIETFGTRSFDPVKIEKIVPRCATWSRSDAA